MFFVLSKLLDVMFSPIAWSVVLIAMALPWRASRPRKPRRDRALGAVGLGVLLLFSLAPVQSALFRALEASARDTSQPDVTYDTVILLGGLLDGETTAERGAPAYNEDVERLLTTFEVLRSGRARTAIVSGGRNGRVIEAAVLRDQLVAWGIDGDRILVEGRSLNTRQNAVETAAIVREHGFTRLLLVTSAYHMARAEGCFRAVGLSPDTLPTDYRASAAHTLMPRANYLDGSTRAIREAAGRLIYRIAGYSK